MNDLDVNQVKEFVKLLGYDLKPWQEKYLKSVDIKKPAPVPNRIGLLTQEKSCLTS